jgi:hypothetical protein
MPQESNLPKEQNQLLEDLTVWHNELSFLSNLTMQYGAKPLTDQQLETLETLKSQRDTLQDQLESARESLLGKESANKQPEATNGQSKGDPKAVGEKMKDFQSTFERLKTDFYKLAEEVDDKD